MIVEDEVMIAMDLEMLLEDMGVIVVGNAPSAAAAYAMVGLHRPDFVTMDINIKGDRDGISAAQEIFDAFGIRSVFISSKSDAATKMRAAPCHAIAWVRKPIATTDLEVAVGRVTRPTD